MKELNQRLYFYFIAFMIMASTFLPLVFTNLPSIVRSHHIWTAIWFFSLITLYPKVFKSKLFLFVLLYGAVMLLFLLNTLWVDISDWNKKQITMEFYEIVVAISVITYFRIEEDFFGLAKLVKWSLLFIFITCVMTIVTTIMEPSYIRSLTGLGAINLQIDVDYILNYKRYGSGNYSFAAGIICLFPMLTYYFKNNDDCIIKKKYLLIFGIVIFITLVKTQLFANILLSTFVIIFGMMGSKKHTRIIILATLSIVALLLIPNQVYADLLVGLSFIFPKDSDLHLKLNEFSRLIELSNYIDTNMSIRADRYPLLMESFIANPFLGHYLSERTNDISAGAHLHWMNKLGVYGLLGSIPFFYIIYNFIKGSLMYLDKEFKFYFLLSALSVVALGLMKALVGREMWYMFFVIVPGLNYLPLLKKIGKRNSYKYSNDINIQPIKT